MKIGVGYIRMSTDNQQESPKMQKNDIQEWADANDVKIIRWYEDLGISGGSLAKRESMMELIFDAEKKLFDIVVFWKYDRVFRNIEEQSVILSKFENLGIEYTGIHDVEGEGASGRLIRNILGAINQFERELTGERIFYSNRHRCKNGFWPGGTLPIGYDLNSETKTLIVNEDEAKLVNLIKDLYLEHRSCYRVAQELNTRGYVSKQGRKFSGVAISGILKNPTYIGKIRWNRKGKDQGKMEVFEGQHEAIWSQEEYENIQRILNSNINNQNGNQRINLLTGLLVCGDCGYKLRPLYARNKNVYYRCITKNEFGNDFCKNNTSIVAKLIDTIVISKLKANLKQTNIKYDKPDIEVKENNIDVEIKRLEGLIEKYKNLYLMDMVTEEELKQNIENYKGQIELLKNNNSKSDIDDSFLDMIDNFDYIYNNANQREKKDLIHSFIDEIMFINKFNFLIKYKNFGIHGWKLQDEVHIDTNKKSISEKEMQRILKKYKG
ncbi:MAG: recombinase family protein [Candidatus Odinarchaeota archaeon]